MTLRRTIPSTLLALLLAAVSFLAMTVMARPAQAAPAAGASAGAGTLARQTVGPAKLAAAKPMTAGFKKVGAPAPATRFAPLPGFCSLSGYDGVGSYITCSVVIPATVFVLCDSGAIFSGTLPGPGIYTGYARPCLAIGYDLR